MYGDLQLRHLAVDRIMGRSVRANRGANMAALIKEGLEDDDLFAEEEDDIDYESEEEEEDVVDSDFDESEGEDDEEVEGQEAEKAVKKDKSAFVKKKRSVYSDPALKKQKTATGTKPAPKARNLTRDQVVPEAAGPRSVRSTTRQVTVQGSAERQKRDREAAERRKMQPLKKGEEIKLTQEELLAEAAITEIENMRSLEEMMKVEEERRKVRTKNIEVSGPRIRFVSNKEGNFLAIHGMDSLFPKDGVTAVTTVMCEVTGEPAKFIDPLTKQPYANLAAFKAIRERAQKLEEAKCDERISQLQSILEEKKKQKVELAAAKTATRT